MITTMRFIFVDMSEGNINCRLSTVNFILHCPRIDNGCHPVRDPNQKAIFREYEIGQPFKQRCA